MTALSAYIYAINIIFDRFIDVENDMILKTLVQYTV